MAGRKPTILFIILAIIIFFMATTLIVDYYWFEALGFEKIFIVNFEARLLIFFASAIAFLSFVIVNLWISSKLKNKESLLRSKIIWAVLAALAFFLGRFYSDRWLEILLFLRRTSFGIADPIFAKDIVFYIFSWPFLSSALSFAIAAVVITLILVLIDYLWGMISKAFSQATQQPNPDMKSVNFKKELDKIRRSAVSHITVLLALFFVLQAARHYLARYSILFSGEGVVVGAGYTDVNIVLPALNILMFIAIVIAAALLVSAFFKKKSKENAAKLLGLVIAGYIVVMLLGLGIVPALVQNFQVSPNELKLEKPFIERNINFTRMAYDLDKVAEKDYDINASITSEVIDENRETIRNIRLLDWRPLTQTYKQTQEIRLYYDLSGIDIDRYDIGGRYTQVMIAPRELQQSQITDTAQTWVNLHMIYTHGYGIVMSPVNNVTKEGLPLYYIKNIPPEYTVDEEKIKIDQPEIYYGEKDNSFILVNTGTKEFDYPKGSTNEYVRYSGKGGVVLDSFVKKLFMAVYFRDVKILLSSEITDESKIMFDRSIRQRISKITPFLTLDHDPYVVIADKKVYWIQDAYVRTANYPYSERYGNFNYIRNSVKVVVDAYNGDVTYYITDKDEPMMKAFSKVYPGEFKRIEDMPSSLREHIRYPEDYFRVQADIYSDYHMDDPNVFYNREDSWEIPNEIYGTGQQIEVEPYYIIMKLPGEDEPEFVLMTTFTPIRKDNMVAWFAARSDGEDYGKLLLYRFPKERLIYGPSQIEARIDQDAEISQQLTLWSQRGSSVTRGNLLVIPLDNTILYVEPLYLQSEQGQLPELKKVIVSDGNRVVMENTLSEALLELLGEVQEMPESIPGERRSIEELLDDANEQYQKILDSMQEGNWSGIGDSLDKLGEILENLDENKTG